MSKQLWIDGILGSQLRDTQGETLSVEGADISELEAGRGRWNDNHGKGFFNCIGRITTAKKIFKAEDCEDDRQRYYWEKVKTPYIYGKGYLFNDEDHPNAKAAAAILRNIHKTDCPLKVKLSVEGGVISRGLSDPSLLARTKIHSCAVTFVPANQATLVEPLNLDKSEVNTEADMLLIKSVMHLAETRVPSFRHIVRDAAAERIENNVNKIMAALGTEDALNLKKALLQDALESRIANNIEKIHQLVKTNSMEKALMAGYGGAGAPTSITGGGVLQSESQELGPKKLSFITCDHCGKEQVYGKFQVKCREPNCGKAFSMAKLEKFFSLQKSKQNSPEEQKKIDEFLRNKKAGKAQEHPRNMGDKGGRYLPPQRPGSFHGEGHTTSGKIVHKRVGFTNNKTGEHGAATVPQQEKHHWVWDHHGKRWNHMHTTLGNATIGQGPRSAPTIQPNQNKRHTDEE